MNLIYLKKNEKPKYNQQAVDNWKQTFTYFVKNKSSLLKDGITGLYASDFTWIPYLDISQSEFDAIMKKEYKKNPKKAMQIFNNDTKDYIENHDSENIKKINDFKKSHDISNFAYLNIPYWDDIDYFYDLKLRKLYVISFDYGSFKMEETQYNSFKNKFSDIYFDGSAVEADKQLEYNRIK